MKKVVLIILMILVVACDDDFSPKADFEEEYTVYSVIKGKDSTQTVFVQRTYNFGGYNPLDYDENTFIEGAEVYIIYDDSTYRFHETVIDSVDNKRLAIPFIAYESNELYPEMNQLMELIVNLPNGKTITAETRTPKFNYLHFNQTIEPFIPAPDEVIDIKWDLVDGDDENQIYLPELKISYYLTEDDGTNTLKEKAVPLNYYYRDNGERIANFPLPINEGAMQYLQESFDTTMVLIGEGIEDKTRIIIRDAELQLILLDYNLVPYYMSIETFLGGYTILLDQNDYSNINGGRGVFASFFIDKSHSIRIDRQYAARFGYKVL